MSIKEHSMVAIKQDATVQPGGVIQIRSDLLPEGARAEVIVLLDAASQHAPTLSSFLGAAKGGFKSPEEVDAFLKAERDSWER
jgi:hypothetical protein